VEPSGPPSPGPPRRMRIGHARPNWASSVREPIYQVVRGRRTADHLAAVSQTASLATQTVSASAVLARSTRRRPPLPILGQHSYGIGVLASHPASNNVSTRCPCTQPGRQVRTPTLHPVRRADSTCRHGQPDCPPTIRGAGAGQARCQVGKPGRWYAVITAYVLIQTEVGTTAQVAVRSRRSTASTRPSQ
jgi:hypothetical protein